MLAEIDLAHSRSRDAFGRRDILAYRECLDPNLEYRDPGGRTRTRDQLLRDVQGQFDRLVTFQSEFQRETAISSGAEVTETGIQHALIVLRWFHVFAIQWKVRRTGSYTWRPTAGGWRLLTVRLHDERVTRDRIGLASRLGAV